MLLLSMTAGVVFYCCKRPAVAPEKAIAGRLAEQTGQFAAAADSLREAIKRGEGEAGLQLLFLKARLAYKDIEWAAEYFEPATARFMNGPPVAEVEPYDGQVLAPGGLQVMEAWLFPHYDSSHRKDLLDQCGLLDRASERCRSHFTNIGIFDWQVFDAVKLEVFRVETTGITGFDDPLTLKSMEESAEALSSVKEVLGHYGDVGKYFDGASAFLSAGRDFNRFDRAAFIIQYANPLTAAITGLEGRLKIHVIRYNRLLDQDAKTLFDAGAFNVNAYSPNRSSFMTPERVALGRRLFMDPVLSGDGSRSCQSCHQPDKVFTDGLVKNTVLGLNRLLKRNTPTLVNAALQPSQFYDMRVTTLENQSRTVVQNEDEMHGAMTMSVERLWRDTSYRRAFTEAFPVEGRVRIDTLEVMNALGSYIRSLTMLNSRFDDYMRGNGGAMSGAEVAGFNLFMGKAKCGTCHYMPLFNGTFPPRYMKTEAEVIGVPEDSAGRRLDPDRGRYDVMAVAQLDHAFKTPTLRNVARTAPYMHNGVYRTLEQVVAFYEKGGGAGLGLRVENQTLPFDKLTLTEMEKGELVAFLRALDSK